ncbi:hypothetical protein B0H19DRAFT_946922 [Mycena capillaripes]|nr:hypothetical protein B0H19DRAFT_946922 [Mycena capillaripes]
MSSYKSFAVVGFGTFGAPIVKALAAQNVSVILLSRQGLDAKKAESVPTGVEVVTVDTADAAAVATVFQKHKVDVVISTISTTAIGAQTVLIDAAKTAGVKLFAPSEFGMTTEGQAENPKNKIIEYTKTVGIPYARFFNGVVTEFVPFLVGFKEHGKVRIVGKGETPASFTSIVDIAGFVSYVLTTLPPSELENRTFRLQGDRATMNELGAIFNTEVEHVDQITGPMGELKTRLMALGDTGVGSTGWDVEKKAEGSGSEAAGSANALWPGHQWRSIKDVISG